MTVTVSAPACAPTAVGVKVTPIAQLELGARVEAQVFDEIAKSPLNPAENVIGSGFGLAIFWLRQYYERLRAARKPGKVAVIAAMRRLLAAVWSVATHRRPSCR